MAFEEPEGVRCARSPWRRLSPLLPRACARHACSRHSTVQNGWSSSMKVWPEMTDSQCAQVHRREVALEAESVELTRLSAELGARSGTCSRREGTRELESDHTCNSRGAVQAAPRKKTLGA